MDNLAQYAVEALGATVTKVNDEPMAEIEYCCDEMRALVEYSNSLFEIADTPEEYDQMIREADHVDIRRAIRDHKCLHPITAELLEASKKNQQLYEKFKKALEME